MFFSVVENRGKKKKRGGENSGMKCSGGQGKSQRGDEWGNLVARETPGLMGARK